MESQLKLLNSQIQEIMKEREIDRKEREIERMLVHSIVFEMWNIWKSQNDMLENSKPLLNIQLETSAFKDDSIYNSTDSIDEANEENLVGNADANISKSNSYQIRIENFHSKMKEYYELSQSSSLSSFENNPWFIS